MSNMSRTETCGMKDTDRAVVHLVTPKGHIKSIWLAKHISSPLVTCDEFEMRQVAGLWRKVAKYPTISGRHKEAGYTLLKDHFEDSEHNFDDYLRWEYASQGERYADEDGNLGPNAIPTRVVQYESDDGRKRKTTVSEPYPDDAMPKSILDLRAGVATEGVWKPKAKPKKTRKAKEPQPEV